MPFNNTFCSSPWFHMRINNSGSYEYCRWQQREGDYRVNLENNIQQQAPLVYFQQGMAPLRRDMLNGQAVSGCQDCYKMEKHGKVSGRQKQLLKTGIQEQYFEKSLISSPLKADFDYSNNNNGQTLRTVVDWQIDLGNYCNGACVFCIPESSSKLATEFKQLKLIDKLPPRSWCDDPVLLEKFIKDLIASKGLEYLHFIGGETLITPGFKKILQALISADLANNITIGFTTNLISWDDDLINNILPKFKQINLGLSVEALTDINDYVRYPSKLATTTDILDQWVVIGKAQGWLMQLRITPTCLSIADLTTVYDYAWTHNLSVESCNFLEEPKFMRISVLPVKYRLAIQDKMNAWLATKNEITQEQIINTRNPEFARQQICQDAESYINYLETAADESYRLPDLIDYLKRLESIRNNSILDYLPQYEELFRSQGY